MSRLKGVLDGPAAVGGDARLQRAGHDRRDHRARAGGAGPHGDSSSSTTARRTARATMLADSSAELGFRLVLQERNQGKGAALRRGFAEVAGDLVIIQDADLEYSPEEYPELIELICQGRADVVYGSRFLGRHRVFLFSHYLGNRLLTLLTNVLYNTMLTDMETCYKVMRTEVLRSMTLRSNGFGIEPELTAKIFKRGYRVYEVPSPTTAAATRRARRSPGATASSRSGCFCGTGSASEPAPAPASLRRAVPRPLRRGGGGMVLYGAASAWLA